MKTLRQLLSNTPSDVIQRAKATTAVIRTVQRVRKKDVDTAVFTIRCKSHTDTEYYDTTVELYPMEVHHNVFEKPSLDSPSWVSCSCPFFTFNCEYALAKAGSSDIEHSNGKPPHITNPRLVPMLCKHLARAANEVVKQALKAAKPDKGEKVKFV